MINNKHTGASVPDQALAVPAEPVTRLGPSGFDPSRERPFWMTARVIHHEEARGAAQRLIASHFGNADRERARVSIPANPDRDDDLLILGYIWQQERASAIEAATAGETHASLSCTVANCFLCEREAGGSTEGESAVAESETPKASRKEGP